MSSLTGLLALIIIALVGVASLFLTWRRLHPTAVAGRTLLLVLRALAVGCLVLMLADPIATRVARVHSTPRVVTLLDRSASMGTKDAPGGRARLDWGTDLLRPRAPLAVLLSEAEASHLLFADSVSQMSAAARAGPLGRATDVGSALAAAVASLPAGRPDAVILVSDGAANRGLRRDELVAWVERQRVPVYCLGIGSQTRPKDAWIAAVKAPHQVRAGHEATITSTVGARGLDGAAVRVSLGAEGIGSQQQEVVLASRVRRQLKFTVRPTKPGLYHCRLQLGRLPGEWTQANNSRSFFLRVTPGVARLLFVAGSPSRELKFIRRALDDSPDLRVTYLVRKSDQGFWEEGRSPERGRRLPVAEALNEYDAVILCDVAAAAFSAAELQRLADFVRERGGGLGMLGGQASFGAGGHAESAIGPGLGVRMVGGSGYSAVPAKARATAAGASLAPISDIERHDDFPGWNALPLIEGLNEAGGVKPGAASLLSAEDGRPLLVIQRYGLGRTLCWMGAGTFRWVLSRDATEASRKGHAVFWTGIVDWLTTPPNRSPVALETDSDVYESGDTARLIVHVSDRGFRPVSGAKVVVDASPAEGPSTRVTLAEVAGAPGRYEAGLPVGDPGTYELKARASAGGNELGSDDREIVAEAPREELADPAQNAGLLRAIAEASGGAYLPAEEIARLPQVARLRPVEETISTPAHWARSLPALLAFLGLVGLDWFLRRWWGVG